VRTPAVIVSGNPIDGFSFYGPFLNASEANNWGDSEMNANSEWWVSDMTPQEKRRKGNGVTVGISGGVLQDCEVEVNCHECGACVGIGEEGYELLDHDVLNK
jgi:hypothetical protein